MNLTIRLERDPERDTEKSYAYRLVDDVKFIVTANASGRFLYTSKKFTKETPSHLILEVREA